MVPTNETQEYIHEQEVINQRSLSELFERCGETVVKSTENDSNAQEDSKQSNLRLVPKDEELLQVLKEIKALLESELVHSTQPPPRAKFVVGLVTLLLGLWAANLALFNWVEPVGFRYLLGEYARYVCAYAGFAAMIFGAMLINDFLIFAKALNLRFMFFPSQRDIESRKYTVHVRG